MSIRGVQRVTGIHRDTTLRLIESSGRHCKKLLKDTLKDLRVEWLQIDEMWSFCHKKQKKVSNGSQEEGDIFVYFGMDAHSKLIVHCQASKRNEKNTEVFIKELAGRIIGEVNITTDGYLPYLDTIPREFGRGRISFCQNVRVDEPNKLPYRVLESVCGVPSIRYRSVSYVERLNLSLRSHVKRWARRTNAHSKKLANMQHMLNIYVAWYNFCRIHESLSCTPAMQHGIADTVWGMDRLIADMV
jgi:IS1 family transposase